MKEDSLNYIKLADDNLYIAKKSFEIGLYRSSCFWSQQAIELYLKAFLIERDKFDPKKHKIHDLILLTKECYDIDKDFEEILKIEKLEEISEYYEKVLYDIESIYISKEETDEAIKITEKVKEFIYKKLKS